jgi:hypothetical protein
VTLPYDWHPDGIPVRYSEAPRALRPGDLVPWEHDVYVITDVTVVPQDQWTEAEWASALEIDERHRDGMYLRAFPYPRPTFVTAEPYRPGPDADPDAGERWLRWRLFKRNNLARYPDEHYPVCARCGEPSPCREVMAGREAKRAAERMGRFEAEGFCPACRQPVSAREGSETFTWNLEIPGGPPVTFHTRKVCIGGLVEYRRRLSEAGYFVAKGIEGVPRP